MRSLSRTFPVLVVRWTLNFLSLGAAHHSHMPGDIQSPISLRGGDSDADNFGLCVSAREKAAIECKDRNLFLILQIKMTEIHNDYAIICKIYGCRSYYNPKSSQNSVFTRFHGCIVTYFLEIPPNFEGTKKDESPKRGLISFVMVK